MVNIHGILALTGLLGLVVGSFLNVVIARLPIMLQRQWQSKDTWQTSLRPALKHFNLAWPASHCPHCDQTLRPWHNIPVLSFLWLKGRCAYCQHRIHWHYPIVELSSLIISLAVAMRWGWSVQGISYLIFSWYLIAISAIDWQHQLIPDSLSLSLLWLGLIASALQLIPTTPFDAIMGAAVGYLSLKSIAIIYAWLRSREGMGGGDPKLLAALGAWLGWQTLPMTVCMAAVSGTAVILCLIRCGRMDKHQPIAFGPYLAIAGWLMMMVAPL